MNKQQAAEALAQKFHEIYERLAPEYGYETRKETSVPWTALPDNNKRLMIAVCSTLQSVIDAGEKPLSAQGMVMVPVEPTDEMYHAGYERINESLETGTIATCGDVYKAMIAARPRGE